MILAIYVDDGMIAAENADAILSITHLKREFDIKIFEAKCFLGLEISQQSDQFISTNRCIHAKYWNVLE